MKYYVRKKCVETLLYIIILGAKNKFVVRTINAGSGVLNVCIDGPSKAAISCREVDEGYEFSYSVFCPGDYLISIKYGNISLAGSPYRSTVTGRVICSVYFEYYVYFKCFNLPRC